MSLLLSSMLVVFLYNFLLEEEERETKEALNGMREGGVGLNRD